MDKKNYIALGLMSGTSMDGVDASIISSDGIDFEAKKDKYYEYDKVLNKNLVNLREKINVIEDLDINKEELNSLEKEITIFHAKVVNDLLDSQAREINPDLIGFHGQTILHKPIDKKTVQLGNAELLSQLTKKKVIFDFRKNDLLNNGQGAPLTPIFHKSLKNKIFKNKIPVAFVNIGGITNATCFSNEPENKDMFAADIGPGNCLIDDWIRKNSNLKFDTNGEISKSGKLNELVLNQALENFQVNFENSLDIKDFDISFARGLTLEDGATTIIHFTSEIIVRGIENLFKKNNFNNKDGLCKFILCGGGRKNKHLVELLKENKLYRNLELVDEHNMDGDFIESQAFAYLAVRSFLNLPLTFPETTGCSKPSTGGRLIKNY